MRKPIIRSLAFAASILLAASTASATAIGPSVSVGVVGGGTNYLASQGTLTLNTDGITGAWALNSPWHSYAAGYEYAVDSWSLTLDLDPFVTNNIVVTNTSGSIQTFVATVLLSIPAFGYDRVINSSVGVTTTDSNGDGNLLFDNAGATPIYVGTVNGGSVLPLNPSGPATIPITIADCGFTGCTAVSTNGVALQLVPGAVATQIGITLTFRLSPGDSAGLTSRFEIVPEPGTLVLAITGLAGLGAVGRRRR